MENIPKQLKEYIQNWIQCRKLCAVIHVYRSDISVVLGASIKLSICRKSLRAYLRMSFGEWARLSGINGTTLEDSKSLCALLTIKTNKTTQK